MLMMVPLSAWLHCTHRTHRRFCRTSSGSCHLQRPSEAAHTSSACRQAGESRSHPPCLSPPPLANAGYESSLMFIVTHQAEAAAAAQKAAAAEAQPAAQVDVDAAEAMDVSADAGTAGQAGR